MTTLRNRRQGSRRFVSATGWRRQDHPASPRGKELHSMLYFYPKGRPGGCTAEACGFRATDSQKFEAWMR